MIDWYRFWDGPANIAFGVALILFGILVGCAAMGILRKMNAKDLATKWFGELQRKYVDLTAEMAQCRMAMSDMHEKMASVVGYAKQRAISAAAAAERFEALIDRPSRKESV